MAHAELRDQLAQSPASRIGEDCCLLLRGEFLATRRSMAVSSCLSLAPAIGRWGEQQGARREDAPTKPIPGEPAIAAVTDRRPHIRKSPACEVVAAGMNDRMVVTLPMVTSALLRIAGQGSVSSRRIGRWADRTCRVGQARASW